MDADAVLIQIVEEGGVIVLRWLFKSIVVKQALYNAAVCG